MLQGLEASIEVTISSIQDKFKVKEKGSLSRFITLQLDTKIVKVVDIIEGN